MSDATRLPIERARPIAEKIAAALAPLCERIEIAGSIRRGRPTIGDIDLVALPLADVGRAGLIERCRQKCTQIKDGEQYAVFSLPGLPDFYLDLWIAHRGKADAGDLFGNGARSDPCNYGVLLLARTGSAAHNIWIAQTAQAAGVHFNPHRGIERRRGGDVIAATEERDIFRALSLDWIAPERRER